MAAHSRFPTPDSSERRRDLEKFMKVGTPHWHPGYTPRVIVKFREAYLKTHEIPYDDRIKHEPERYLRENWATLLKQFQGITIQPRITSVSPDDLIHLVEKAREQDESYSHPNNLFLTYFVISCPPPIDPLEVVTALRWWDTGASEKVGRPPLSPAIELAYVEGRLTPFNPGTPATVMITSPLPKYLGPAPDGIDAKYAWTKSGGDGGNADGIHLRFVDIEQGWDLASHTELQTITSIYGGTGSGDINHGTAVLGVLFASNNNGCAGITPEVTTKWVASDWPSDNPTDLANAIVAAIPADNSKLCPGDVLLLEAQWTDYYGYYDGPGHFTGWQYGVYTVPVEVDHGVFQLISNATSRGIVVVEAAGDGGLDLDAYTHYPWYFDPDVQQLNRNSWTPSTDYDSLAIMVGAATASTSAQPRRPMEAGTPPERLHNYGSRVDCYAWGERIITTGANASYVAFSDTSGAAAIIAGAALAVQGVAQFNKKGDLTAPSTSANRFTPGMLRTILTTGTSSSDPTTDKIGVMPDLKQIITTTLGIP